MKRSRIQPQASLAGFGRAQDHSKTAENILQDRHAFLQMRFEFHPELGQGSPGDDSNSITYARLNQAGAVNHRVQRTGTKGFCIRARGVFAAGLFCDGLGEIAATAVVAIAHGLFRTANDVIDFPGI